MRKISVLAAGAIFVLTGVVARAEFVLTESRSTGTFDGATRDVVTFQIQNTGTGSTAGTTKLLALDLTMQAFRIDGSFEMPGHLYIHTFDQDGSGVDDDADFENLSNRVDGAPPLSFIRFGTANFWVHVSSMPPQNSPDDSIAVRNPTPYTDGQSVPQFEVVGGPNITGGGSFDIIPKTVAMAVVDPGEIVFLSGEVGAESGPPVPVSIPEPATFSLLVAAPALFLRRR